MTGPLPLVLVFHGGGGNIAVIANQLGFNNLAAPRPYLTVFAQGFGPTPVGPSPLPPGVPTDGAWNSGHSYIGALAGQDDVAFVDAILLDVTRRTADAGWRIDQSRTYAVGYSNGGMMTYRLAAERSSDFAAVAVFAGCIGGEADPGAAVPSVHLNDPGLHGAEPVSLLHIHGILDPVVPYYGGIEAGGPSPRSDLPAADAVDIWVDHNRCNRRPSVEAHPMGLLRTWSGGDDGTEVKLLTGPGLDHSVPTGAMLMIEPFLLSHSK